MATLEKNYESQCRTFEATACNASSEHSTNTVLSSSEGVTSATSSINILCFAQNHSKSSNLNDQSHHYDDDHNSQQLTECPQLNHYLIPSIKSAFNLTKHGLELRDKVSTSTSCAVNHGLMTLCSKNRQSAAMPIIPFTPTQFFNYSNRIAWIAQPNVCRLQNIVAPIYSSESALCLETVDAGTTTEHRIVNQEKWSRKKTNVACIPCVKAKSGCDSHRPCTRCVRLKREHRCVDRPRTVETNKSQPIPRHSIELFDRRGRSSEHENIAVVTEKPIAVCSGKEPRH